MHRGAPYFDRHSRVQRRHRGLKGLELEILIGEDAEPACE
jgi:hypothetical protein